MERVERPTGSRTKNSSPAQAPSGTPRKIRTNKKAHSTVSDPIHTRFLGYLSSVQVISFPPKTPREFGSLLNSVD
jgi:hypothetical protein